MKGIWVVLLVVGGCAGKPPQSLDARMKAGHDERKELLCDAYRKHHGISRAARGEVRFQYQDRWIKCRW